MEIIAQNNNELFKKAVLGIRQHGEESGSGNSQVNTDGTRFIDGPVTATVVDPADRWLNVEGRKSSAVAAIGETLWVLAGRNDLKWLSRFLGRAHNFSDDGLTWRGAYGPRLYSEGQLQSVINRLKANHNTRQAYLTIYDPMLDSDWGLEASHPESLAKTKDMICNLALLFDIKKGALNLTVINRSQDVLWGMSSINFIEFSILQEIIARILNVQLGVYRLVSNNLHYYNNKVSQDQLELVTEATEVKYSRSSPILFNTLAQPSPDPNTQEVRGQADLKVFFSTLLDDIEIGKDWNRIETQTLHEWGAAGGLIMDMAYVAYCRYNNIRIDLKRISDKGLGLALIHSPIDSKYLAAL